MSRHTATTTSVPSTALGDATRMGPVVVVVADLDEVRDFYAAGVGLEIIAADGRQATLGVDGRPLLVLRLDDGAAPESRRTAGLFHSALLFDDPAQLSAALVRLVERTPGAFIGSADHLVSLAFYFRDPEANEVELYTDRPRDTWRTQDGRIQMANAPLDLGAFVADHPPADGPITGVTMGHVHLRVGDAVAARRFYGDVLGFAVTSEWPSAVFLAAGGYHHHLGANAWQSAGAGTRPDGVTGLASVTIEVASSEEVAAVAARLDAAGVTHEALGDGLLTADPWGNRIRVVVAATA